jgi:hypothetical protein
MRIPMARFVQPRLNSSAYRNQRPPDPPPTGGDVRNRLVPSPARRFLLLRDCDVAAAQLGLQLAFLCDAVAYLNRSSSKRSAGSTELVGLMFVLVAGAATAYWAGERIGMDLSSLSAIPTLLGFGQTSRPISGAQIHVSPPAESAPATSTAPYCQPGQTPAFVHGLAELKQQLGDTMGTPVECEHPATAAGDTVQQTTTGLAAYHQRSNMVTFTDGWQHWALTPSGIISWEGTQSEPPSPSS